VPARGHKPCDVRSWSCATTPEPWRRIAGMCARVPACAGTGSRQTCTCTYIHTYKYLYIKKKLKEVAPMLCAIQTVALQRYLRRAPTSHAGWARVRCYLCSTHLRSARPRRWGRRRAHPRPGALAIKKLPSPSGRRPAALGSCRKETRSLGAQY
jgi:hypothetical protein